MATDTEPGEATGTRWVSQGVGGIGVSSAWSQVGSTSPVAGAR
jgi:hypothetical protein